MKRTKFIYLPSGRWCIEHNGISGPARDYSQIAYWPNEERPEMFGHTQYFDQGERLFIIKEEVSPTCIESVDRTLG